MTEVDATEGILYTRAGDQGETGLLGGERVPKWDLQPQALGALDEASSALGLARALSTRAETKEALLAAQRRLYAIMAELATGPGVEVDPAFQTSAEDVRQLEAQIDAAGSKVALGREFVLPGEIVAGAALDLARAVVRRAEREVTRLSHERGIGGGPTMAYLNRLSSLLFVLARFEERAQGRRAPSAKGSGGQRGVIRRKRP